MTEGFWEHIALRLDDGTRRSDHGRTLLGGSPLRIVRLSDAGARALDELTVGAPVGGDPARQRLARRLLDVGLAHPVPLRPSTASVSLVIPVRDHAPDLAALLDALEGAAELPAEVIVVDDGSRDPDAVTRAVAGRGQVVRRERPGGPAAARNAGWTLATGDLVVCVDADVLPEPGWLDVVTAHFVDPVVAAVAPRVRGRRASDSALDRYEEHRSPLDLGPAAARVAPRTRVAYVPTAAIVYRRTVLEQLGGFDEALPVGEDVDLVWRVVGAGHTVRYEPGALMTHRNRGSWPALAVQRARYGSAAAALERRHPGMVPPVELDAWSMASWALPVLGGRRGALAGLATASATTAALLPKLRGRFDRPGAEAIRLGGLGNLWAGRWLAHATVRTWLPLALGASLVSRRARRSTALALVAPPLLDWHEQRPDLDPVRWVAASVVDHASYCAGVWWGCRRERSWRVLTPRLSRIPGLTGSSGVPPVTPGAEIPGTGV